MKNTLIILVLATIFLSCNNSKNVKTVNDVKVSWQKERFSEYQLVRPIEFQKNAIDAYGIQLTESQWYLITRKTGYFFTPVKVQYGMSPSFIEKVIKWNKIAALDTMSISMLNEKNIFEGLNGINTVEIVCFKDYEVFPIVGQQGEISVEAKKK